MSEVRYQVFISSTYSDLKDERVEVHDAILAMKHFPAGMEMFPASHLAAWNIIERVIIDSDFYLLIIGGRYGSTAEDGVSYTEREYDFAIAQNKPVFAFLHKSPDSIPIGRSEKDKTARDRLSIFREKVERHHHCNYWSNAAELKVKVITSLATEIPNISAIGWVRADGIDNKALMQRLVVLQERYDRLEAERDELKRQLDASPKEPTEQYVHGEEYVELTFSISAPAMTSIDLDKIDPDPTDRIVAATVTLDDLFFNIAKDLVFPRAESLIAYDIAKLLFESHRNSGDYKDPADDIGPYVICPTEETTQDVRIQFIALGLIECTQITHPRTINGVPEVIDAWKLTTAGTNKMIHRFALKIDDSDD